MKKYHITSYQSEDAARWNAFNKAARNGSFLFNRGFMDYHRDRFTDHSLIVLQEDEIAALLPANVSHDKVISHQGLTYGGLVCKDLSLEEFITVFKLILQFLERHSISLLRLKTLPHIYHQTPSQDLEYALYLAGATLVRRDTLAVCEPTKRPVFSSLRKRGYRKAVRQGLMVAEDQNFEGFWNNVLVPNLDRKHQVLPVHSLEEIRMLAAGFPDNIRQFNVYDGDRIVAGTTIFENNTVAHAQYISTFGGEKNGALDFLFAYLMEHVFVDKPYFDFGISNESEGMKLNVGLANWKQGFGTGTVLQDCYEVPTHHHSRLQDVFI